MTTTIANLLPLSTVHIPFTTGLGDLFFRFVLNMLFSWILIDRIYYRVNKQREYLFTFFCVNILIFFVSSLLADIKVKTGFAFGLFAIFSILRYRTEQLGIKEMTFLFGSIILAVLNSMVTIDVSLGQILFANTVIVIFVYFLEKRWLRLKNSMKMVTYDKIELINGGRETELLEDLKNRTGLAIRSIEIQSIDLLKDSAEIAIYYDEKNKEISK